ncbi:unnamed protein product [Agarophyton chilense]
MVITTRSRKRRLESLIDEPKPDPIETVEDFEPNESDQSSESSPQLQVVHQRRRGSSSHLEADGDQSSEQLCWTDRYSHIQSQTGLAVSTKKFNEIVEWLGLALDSLAPRFLVLSGPPGCGKGSAVKAACEKLGCKLVSWEAPLTVSTSISAALIEDFHSFVIGAQYRSLVSTPNEEKGYNGSKPPPMYPENTKADKHVLVIDDLPLHISDIAAYRESIQQLFGNIAKFAPYPAILLLSDNDKGIYRMSNMVLGTSLLNSQWVGSITVPPVSASMMKKRLQQILALESITVSRDQIDLIVSSSNGDIRSALNNLHMFITCAKQTNSNTQAELSLRRKKRPRVKKETRSSSRMQLDRDITLSTYHAVSKILNNKRSENGRSRYVAEDILDEARIDPSTFISFLHHNYPDFFGNSDDVVPALTCLSEADTLLPWRQEDDFRFDLRECAASIVTRGFLYFNTQPNRNGWRPIRGPESHKIWKASRNHVQYSKAMFAGCQGRHLSTRSELCETLPYAKKISELSASGCFPPALHASASQEIVCDESRIERINDSHSKTASIRNIAILGDLEVEEDLTDPIEEYDNGDW